MGYAGHRAGIGSLSLLLFAIGMMSIFLNTRWSSSLVGSAVRTRGVARMALQTRALSARRLDSAIRFLRSQPVVKTLKRDMCAAAAEVAGSQRVRFAPSPTGSLHVGGARTALYNWLIARKEAEGKFVLRVEDTDVERSTKESEKSVLGDLEWLGLKWDEGPFRQSERGEIYKEMVQKLVDSGHAYPCFSTDKELEEAKEKALAEGKNAKYDGKWRDADPEVVKKMLEDGVPHTYRFKVPKGEVISIDDKVRGKVSWDAEATLGDFILLRSTGIPVYNFCVAVDDALMGISTVIRAEEHLTNTLRQVLILNALGFKPPQYAHLSLILGQDKQKLSKRHGATSVTQFKDEGFLPDAMINYLALLGWNEGVDQEIYSVDELVEKFALERVIKSPAVFDMEKLRWVNGQHIKGMEVEELQKFVSPFFESASPSLPTDPEFIKAATKMSQQRMDVLIDSTEITRDALGHPLTETLETAQGKKLVEGDESFADLASTIVKDYETGTMPLPRPDSEDYGAEFKKWAKQVGKTTGRKGKQLFMPLRLLLTGRMQGPEVPDQLALAEAAGGKAEGVVSIEQRMKNIQESFPIHSGATTAAETTV